MNYASLLNEWFVARRGLAYGIVFGGGGAFGIFLPLFFQKLLTTVGYAYTMRIWSAILVCQDVPNVVLISRQTGDYFITGDLLLAQI